MNRGDLGARNLNQLLQAKLNPPQDGKPQVERFGYTYRVGDKVLQTEIRIASWKRKNFIG